MKDLYDPKTEKAGQFLEEFFNHEQGYKVTWARQAERQVAFANGDQGDKDKAAPIMVNNQPVNDYANDKRSRMYETNEIEPILRTLVSYMTKNKPTIDITPESPDAEDRRLAKVSENVTQAKYDIDREVENSRLAAWWAMALGTSFGKDFWDMTRGQYIGRTDGQGNTVLDAEGNPDQYKTGNNNVAILTPFSVSVDHSITNFDDQNLIGESYMMDIDWAKEAFNQDLPGYTGKADQITEDRSTANALNTLEEMKFSLPHVGMGKYVRTEGKCLVQEWYARPNKDWKRGRMMVRAGGVWVYDSSKEEGCPYFMPLEEEMWHPYSCFIFEPYVGRFLGKSLVEQLMPLQMRLNEINGAILENANTLAKPNILAAINQLKRGVLNGKGGMIYTYQQIPGAPPPTTLGGIPLPAQFFNEKEQLIDQMVRIAGTNFIMSGKAPAGVTAARALELILENASGQHSSTMAAWQRFHEDRFTKKLRVLKAFGQHNDKQLARYIRMLSKDSLDQEITDFVASEDLADNISVKISEGSMIPKSEASRRDLYKELGKEGIFGPMGEPGPQGDKIRRQFLERIGETPLDTEESIEFKKASWENDRIMHNELVEVSEYDVDAIHIVVHKSKIQNPEFLERGTDEQKIKLDDHLKQHEQAEIAKAMKEQQKQMAMQPPPPGPMGLEGPPPAPGGEGPLPPEGGMPA